MLLTSLAIALLTLPLHPLLAKQIPNIDGTYGGVRHTPSAKFSAARPVSEVTIAATTPGKLRIVENSGVCETTPGVYQASGYGDLTSTESIWSVKLRKFLTGSDNILEIVHRFWFFAARSNPDNAPLAIWLNGGVCSSTEAHWC